MDLQREKAGKAAIRPAALSIFRTSFDFLNEKISICLSLATKFSAYKFFHKAQ
jgi:hypothetical protein